VSLRVLIAEDDDTLRSVIRMVLESDGFQVTEASSGEQALELFNKRPFPIVLSDVVMGGMSGLDLLGKVVESAPETQFVIMTSHASLETATSALRAGAYDYLIKPFDDIGAVSGVIARAAEKVRLAEENRRLVENVQRNSEELHRLNETLQDMANRDALTGLHNRRYFLEALDREIARCARHGRTFTIVLFDVDHFKKFNDSYGHLAGDDALKSVGRVVKDNLRASNVAARYGGEEFVVLLAESDRKAGLVVAERIRSAVRAVELRGVDARPLPPLSVSLGVASWGEDGTDATSLIEAADRALYRAKELGRNRVCAAGSETPRPEVPERV